MSAPAESPSRRRAGVFRRALRREASRLRDRRRLLAMAILITVGGIMAAAIIARGDQAGADARAYWAAVRIWLNGGDPYHPTGPFLPYVYAPWMLPLFAPWAVLPWDVAWVVWRGGSILLLCWTIDWAYRRRPLATAVAFLLLFFPIGANLDTGNIDIFLVFMLWGAQSAGPRLAGLLWAIATWMKWVPGLFWVILAPRARKWGLIWLAVAAVLSLLTLPLTVLQLQALFGFGARPIRLDYLALLWALVPWWWRNPDPLWFLRPWRWPGIAASVRATARRIREAWRKDPTVAWSRVQRGTRVRVRAYLGLEGGKS
jgi:glycosyl transferase family 87